MELDMALEGKKRVGRGGFTQMLIYTLICISLGNMQRDGNQGEDLAEAVMPSSFFLFFFLLVFIGLNSAARLSESPVTGSKK